METFLLIFGLVVLTAVVFVGWLIFRVVAFLFGAIFNCGNSKNRYGTTNANLPPGWSTCQNPSCRLANPPHARFCRRCGNPAAVGVTRMRYVA